MEKRYNIPIKIKIPLILVIKFCVVYLLYHHGKKKSRISRKNSKNRKIRYLLTNKKIYDIIKLRKGGGAFEIFNDRAKPAQHH